MTKRKLRVAVLMHAHLAPPDSLEGLSEKELNDIKQEADVCSALAGLGHEVIHVPVVDELAPIRRILKEHKPHLAFNLLTHFHDAGIYDSAVVSWLELMKQLYTGCNPRGLLAANDKALFKKVLAYHRIRAPRFFVAPRGKRLPRLRRRSSARRTTPPPLPPSAAPTLRARASRSSRRATPHLSRRRW